MNAIVNISRLFKSAKERTGLSKFNGGVHPPQYKLESTTGPIRSVEMPRRLVLPLRQHVGNLAKLQVSVGDHVWKGQLLAKADGQVSASVHAPTSGVIVSIENQLIPHPSGLPDVSITLEARSEEHTSELQSRPHLVCRLLLEKKKK